MTPFDRLYAQNEFVFASDMRTDPSLPPPEPVPDEEAPAADSRYPGHWAHRKIAWVDANLARDDRLFDGWHFISLRVRYIDPEQSNPNKYLRIWSYQPGTHQIWDPERREWAVGQTDGNNSLIVRVPEHEVWLHGYRFCPQSWAQIHDGGGPLVLYVQNFHRDGDRMVMEGNEPPNKDNKLLIDRRVEYPFPGAGDVHRFWG